MPALGNHPSTSPLPKLNTIGHNIQRSRVSKGLTQLALAHAIGLQGVDAGAQIARYEAGKVEPRLSTLARIAEVLGVSVNILLVKPAK